MPHHSPWSANAPIRRASWPWDLKWEPIAWKTDRILWLELTLPIPCHHQTRQGIPTHQAAYGVRGGVLNTWVNWIKWLIISKSNNGRWGSHILWALCICEDGILNLGTYIFEGPWWPFLALAKVSEYYSYPPKMWDLALSNYLFLIAKVRPRLLRASMSVSKLFEVWAVFLIELPQFLYCCSKFHPKRQNLKYSFKTWLKNAQAHAFCIFKREAWQAIEDWTLRWAHHGLSISLSIYRHGTC